MTGRGINVLLEAFLILVHELYSWMQKRRGTKPKKE